MRFGFALSGAGEFDAAGFGLNAVDHLIVVQHYPRLDTKIRFLEHRQSAGGQTASAMVALRRLGLRTIYAGRFGSDDEGRLGVASLRNDGVDLRFIEVVPHARTQTAFIIIEAGSGERTIIWDRDDRLAYSVDEAPEEVAKLGRVLHLDGHDPPAGARLARAAHEAGALVSADIDNIYEGLPELLPLIDILISSKEFPARLTGITEPRQALRIIRDRYGCAMVGMTRGDQGALLYYEGQFLESPAFVVPGGCRDTTGAGDAFHGGFLYGLLRGEDVETSLRFANATAALKCRMLGARDALPSETEIIELVRGNQTIPFR